jgi:hypothetical protein
MVNKYRGEVSIEYQNNEGVLRSYTLCFPINSIVRLEEVSGNNFISITKDLMQGNISIKMIRQILWAGLIAKQPTMTQEAVGEIIDEVGLQEMINKINESFEAAFPTNRTEDGGETAGANPPQLGNGKISRSHL